MKDHQALIFSVDEDSIAGLSGICSGDIIRSIGKVDGDQMDKFEFTKVTKEAHVTSALTEQPRTVIGSVLIIERPKMSYI